MNKDNSELPPDPNSELELIFREHWNHARHCENERLQFTSIYAAVVAAILYFIGTIIQSNQENLVPILLLTLFGLALSVIGFLTVITLSLGYEHHITDIHMIFYRWDKMELYRHPGKPVYFMDVHRWFYEITITLFTALLLYYVFISYEFKSWVSIIVSALILIHIKGLYRLRWRKYIKECWEFEAALRNDTERRYEDWDEWFKDLNFRAKIINDAKKRKKN